MTLVSLVSMLSYIFHVLWCGVTEKKIRSHGVIQLRNNYLRKKLQTGLLEVKFSSFQYYVYLFPWLSSSGTAMKRWDNPSNSGRFFNISFTLVFCLILLLKKRVFDNACDFSHREFSWRHLAHRMRVVKSILQANHNEKQVYIEITN